MSAPAHDLPGVGPLGRWLGRLLLRLGGWTLVGTVPAGHPRMVMIAAPHTSNWDYVWMVAVAWALGVRIHAVGKKSLFWFPLGLLLRWLGLIPIDRKGGLGLVDQLAAAVLAAPAMLLAIPPAGTRRKTDRWRSGFYWVAHKAEVPILMGFLDYGSKRTGVLGLLETTGDVGADMDQIRARYAGFRGRDPAAESTIVLREECEG